MPLNDIVLFAHTEYFNLCMLCKTSSKGLHKSPLYYNINVVLSSPVLLYFLITESVPELFSQLEFCC